MNIQSIIKTIATLAIASTILYSCKKPNPVMPHPEEEITSVDVVFIKMDGAMESLDSTKVTFNASGVPTPSVAILESATSYRILVTPFNGSTSLVSEILDEGDEHQFFFFSTPTNGITSYAYKDIDGDGRGIGTDGLITTGVTNCDLNIILRHGLNKASSAAANYNSENYADAGGEDDLNIVLPIKY